MTFLSNNFCKTMTAALLLAAVLLSACAAGTPTPPLVTVVITVGSEGEIATAVAAALTGTAAPVTSTPDGRSTLPPTWTPTFTALPPTEEPPTATITPSRTPTITPTISAEAICAEFYTVNNLKTGQIFAWKSQISLFLSAVPPDATVRFLAVHHFSQANRGAELPGGQNNILQLPIRNLPEPGQYDWTLVVKTTNYGDICEQSGWFIATTQESTRAEESRIR
jgi:hypothetical protein